MKKMIAILFALTIILSLSACGNNVAETTKATVLEETANPTEVTEEDKTTGIDPNTWGVYNVCPAGVDMETTELFCINTPYYGGINGGRGKVADQADGTCVIYGGQNEYCPEISGISELFPAYYSELEFILQDVFGLLAENFAFQLDKDEALTVNGRDMHRFEGSFTFNYDGEPYESQFVAFATVLKTNGAYAYWLVFDSSYWLVFDSSDNQTNGHLIAEHAYNMAQTFREMDD